MTRQRIRQIEQNKKGICGHCKKPLSPESNFFCEKHLKANRKNSLRCVRIKHGILPNKRLHPTRGRPRGIGGPKLPIAANAMIGTMSDEKVAKQFNVSGQTVRARRIALGIAALGKRTLKS